MLSLGLVGEHSGVAAVATILGELGATVVGDSARVAWRADDPTIVVYQSPTGPVQAVLGVGTEPIPAEADIWLDGKGSAEQVTAAVHALWTDRLMPFEATLRAGRREPRRRQTMVLDPDPTWPSQASRLIARLRDSAGDSVIRIDHIGSTAVAGLPAREVLDIQLVVDDLGAAGRVAEAARPAGFVSVPGQWFGTDRYGTEHPEEVLVGADPGRPANLHIRPVWAPIWLETLLFRDWLRAHNHERDAYAAVKRELANRPAGDADAYRADRMPWIQAAMARAEQWTDDIGWSPPD
jgi:dephospho-CoA kinase